jgi:hypothetical protein
MQCCRFGASTAVKWAGSGQQLLISFSKFMCVNMMPDLQLCWSHLPILTHGKSLAKCPSNSTTVADDSELSQILFAFKLLQNIDDFKALARLFFLDELGHFTSEKWRCYGLVRCILRQKPLRSWSHISEWTWLVPLNLGDFYGEGLSSLEIPYLVIH